MGDRAGPVFVLAYVRTLGDMVHYRTLLALTCPNAKCTAWTAYFTWPTVTQSPSGERVGQTPCLAAMEAPSRASSH